MQIYKDTIIGTKRGPIKASNLKEGDYIIGANYSFNRIVNIKKNFITSDVLKFKGMCIPEMICSEDTLLYVSKKRRIYKDKKTVREFDEPIWIKAKEITQKDYFLSIDKNPFEKIPTWSGTTLNFWGHDTVRSNIISEKLNNENFWYLMGRYIGDGWARRNYKDSMIMPGGIIICCTDKDEDSLIKSVINSGFKYTKTKERTTYRITIYSKELFYFVQRFSNTAYNKIVDFETMCLPKELLINFINGYTDSDGCFTENNYKITSVSPYLIYGIAQCILKSFNTNYRIYHSEMPPKKLIEGRLINQKDQFQIVWNHNIPSKNKKSFIKNNKLWFPLKEVVNIKMSDCFYNIELEDENIGFNNFYVISR